LLFAALFDVKHDELVGVEAAGVNVLDKSILEKVLLGRRVY
jgi:hypothetical protein